MTVEEAVRKLAEAIIEHGLVEYHCDLCSHWRTIDPAEAKAHHELMNKGKPRNSQWWHEIYPVKK